MIRSEGREAVKYHRSRSRSLVRAGIICQFPHSDICQQIAGNVTRGHYMVSDDYICNTNSPDYNNRDCLRDGSTKHQASSQAPVLCAGQAKVGLTMYLCWPHSLSINLIRLAAAGADLSHIWLWSGSGPAPNQPGPDIKKLISSPAQAAQATARHVI